jgi:hypothetical protein
MRRPEETPGDHPELAVQLQATARERANLTYAPLVVAAGLVFTAVALTLWPPAALATIAVLLAGIGLWALEGARSNPDLVPPEEKRGARGLEGLRRPDVYWWGGLGFGFLAFVAHVAAMRVSHAHGLLDRRLAGAPVDPWLGHAAAALAGLVLLVSFWTTRAAARPALGRMPRALAALTVAGAAEVILLAVQLGLWTSRGTAQGVPAAAWLLAVHVGAGVGGVAAAALLVARLARADGSRRRWSLPGGIAAYWRIHAFNALLVYATLYLRLFNVQSYLI